MFLYLLETANIMFLSFIRFELLSFERGNLKHTNVKYNSVVLLLGYNQVFFHPEVLNFLPIYFPHILSISGKAHFHGKDLIVQSLIVHLKDRKNRVEVSSYSWHLK